MTSLESLVALYLISIWSAFVVNVLYLAGHTKATKDKCNTYWEISAKDRTR